MSDDSFLRNRSTIAIITGGTGHTVSHPFGKATSFMPVSEEKATSQAASWESRQKGDKASSWLSRGERP